jgi:hypothetical protein
LRVEVKDETIKGFLDGSQVIGVQDTTFKWGKNWHRDSV